MEKVILTNMCMIYDKINNQVLFVNRKKSWPGFAFPGGHVENKEPIVPSVIREIKEETGLDIINPKLAGIRDWYEEDANERTVSFLFVCETFSGTLKEETDEGKVEWVKINELDSLQYAYGFKQQLPLFFENKWVEIFSYIDKNKNTKYLFY